MPASLGSRLHIAALALLLLALLAGLARHGAFLVRELRTGADRWRTNHPAPAPPAAFADPLAGVTARLPDRVRAVVFAGGVLMKLDEDALKGALVCPLIGDRSVPATEVLTAVYRSWMAGYREAGDALRMSPMRDEGSRVSAHIETGRGDDAVSGEIALVRTDRGYRLEAFWSLEADFNADRAMLVELVRGVRLAPGAPVKMQFAPHHGVAVPPGYDVSAVQKGLELAARAAPSARLSFLAGAGHADARTPEELLDRFLARSRDPMLAVTGTLTSYPLLKRNEQAWDLAACSVEMGGEVRGVITAALTDGRDGRAWMVSVRRAPRAAWSAHGFALAYAEASALWLPDGPGGRSSALPLTHVEDTWELVRGWEIGRALRTGPQVWREALMPPALRANARTRDVWAMPVWLAGPDGTFLDPDDPLETLVR